MRKGLKYAIAVSAIVLTASSSVMAQKKYDPGASDTEIKLGQTMPLSGPVSAFSTIGKSSVAYFAMVNKEGGINGRKINLISLDDGFSPPKAVEQTRKYVEQDRVLANFSTVGAPQNTAIQKYLAAQKVPQMFVASGATKWGDHVANPTTIGWQPSYEVEGKMYVEFVLEQVPNAKIAILYPNDDGGRDYLAGIKKALGDRAKTLVVAEASHESTDPSIDSQIVTFMGAGANVFLDMTTPKFAAQAIRKAYDIGWKPLHVVHNASASVAAVMVPAGVEKAVGVVSGAYMKDPTDQQWANDAGVKAYLAWIKEFYPDGNPTDILNVYGYSIAMTMAHVIKMAGDDLTRANLMRQATNIKNLELPMLLPGIKINTSPTDYFPIKQQRMQRFDGTRWIPIGEVRG